VQLHDDYKARIISYTSTHSHTIPVSSSTGWLKRRSMTFRGNPRRPTICWEEFYLPLLFPSWLRGLACASPEPFEGTDSGSSNSSGALPSAHRWLPLGVPPASVLCADFSLPPRAVGSHPAPPWFGEIRRPPATAHRVTRSFWSAACRLPQRGSPASALAPLAGHPA